MNSLRNFRKKYFSIYGFGITGKSAVNFLKKHKNFNYKIWDDDFKKRLLFKDKNRFNNFINSLNKADYILISPGIIINNSKFKKELIKNKHKIITDLDLFFLVNSNFKSIVVTGTNGKSTTCKIIEHFLKKNKYNVKIGGNIGKPILDIKVSKKMFVIIEASSFQLSYSKFIKPDYAIMLNITNDHLDWHKNMKNYIDSKMKIFQLQGKKDYALISDKKLIHTFKKKNYLCKYMYVSAANYLKIKDKINNSYLNSRANIENMSFAYTLSKVLKVSDSKFINSFKNFKGLSHRYEIFLKKGNTTFINDSKATTFKATHLALSSHKNIFWIVGGLPKLNDKFSFKKINKNIIKAYIIGTNINFFKKQLKNKINFSISKSLKKSINQVFKDLHFFKKNNVVLLSPASASFDQYKNFQERGNEFKKLVKFKIKKNA